MRFLIEYQYKALPDEKRQYVDKCKHNNIKLCRLLPHSNTVNFSMFFTACQYILCVQAVNYDINFRKP